MKLNFSTWRIFWSMYLTLLGLEFINLLIPMSFIKYAVVGITIVLIAISLKTLVRLNTIIREESRKGANQ